MKKRVVSLFLICTLAFYISNTVIFADTIQNTEINNNKYNNNDIKVDGINYTIIETPFLNFNGKVSLSNNQNLKIKELTIPSNIKIGLYYYDVVAIEDNAFSNNQNLQTITIGENISKISGDAFSFSYKINKFEVPENNKNFSAQDGVLFDKKKTKIVNFPVKLGLKEYTIPKTVTEIGDFAFFNNYDLIKVILPEKTSVKIGSYSFASTKNLVDIENLSVIQEIGNYGFSQTSIEKFNVLENLKKLGLGAFYNSRIAEFTASKYLTELPEYTFANCDNLKTVKFSSYVERVKDFAFYNSSIDNIVIGENVTFLGKSSFESCYNLKDITLNEKLVAIEDRAFYNTPTLYSIVLPKELFEVGNDVFLHSDKLEKIQVNPENKNFYSRDGVLFTKDLTELICYPPKLNMRTFEVPLVMSKIRKNAFYSALNLERITVAKENKFFSEENGVLYSLDKLKLYKFPPAKVLNNFEVNATTTTIGESAFSNLSNLQGTVLIPESVTTIEVGAFDNAFNVNNISVSNGNSNFVDVNGVLYTKDKLSVVRYPIGRTGNTYKLEDGVNFISPGAFQGTFLNKVEIGNDIKSIGSYAFKNSKLKEINLPETLNSIGQESFFGCGLQEINLNSGIKSIGEKAFSDMRNLSTFKFNKDINAIEFGDFFIQNNYRLKKIYVPIRYSYDYKIKFNNLGYFDLIDYFVYF